ncbi:hypothetical protein [Chlorobium sp. N1]|uniref:hypothetical protein n=1 Tax=Chlorobium sp. N1 TaxID=2491138 RepID=UPI00103908D6|nr:hypothetical protein [Chlorobium sp. N1]TCD47373.1 hypothetical protein E0L29_08825 [Chlorobium sp. N1]
MNQSCQSGDPDSGVRCFVSRCSCGAHHIHYRHAVVKVGRNALMRIMEECLLRERKGPELNRDGYRLPFVIMLGIVTLSVPWKEFALFSRVIGEAVSDEIGIAELAARLAMPGSGMEG